MKTPQIPAMPGYREPNDEQQLAWIKRNIPSLLNPLAADQKTVAERQWQKPNLAPAPQKQCDIGLFSDDAKQTELF